MRRKRPVRQKAKGPIDPRIGQRLRELRSAAGLTQAQLAGSDFTKGFVSLVETGRARTSLRAAQVFAFRLGVPLAELVDSTPSSTAAARLRGLLARAARIEETLAQVDRLRADLAAARADLERELDAETRA